MRKLVAWKYVFFLVFFIFSFGSACHAEEIKVEDVKDTLQQQGLSATITAINLEIDRYQQWIDFRKQQDNQKDLARLQETLSALQEDLAKYLSMDAKDYTLPEKIAAVAWVGNKPEKNSILYVEGMSKSGPWYHLAGVVGNDYSILQTNSKYPMTFYTVYPRSYWGMNSAYVYISAVGEPSAGLANVASGNKEIAQQQAKGKRITGEVFVRKYNVPFNEEVKCENYQVYLLKEIEPGSKGELILDSKQSSFDFILSEENLKKYSYLEFVSAYEHKTIKLNDIKDDPLKIILGKDVFLKKPAIYLYPTEKSQITITHNFKGKILNTYPIYTDNWTVIAEPNGNLLNVKDNRYYKYLFWDGVYCFSHEHYQFQSGFYVKSENYVSFLQSKLTMIGLNENEINDFIVYWLPTMSKYKNCFIHFRINDNIDGSSVIQTKPQAETTIRIFMEFTGIDNINSAPQLPEQTLPAFMRKGLTLVEWGGAEITNSKIE